MTTEANYGWQTFQPGAPRTLAGFAFTTWMLSMVNAGWFNSDALGLVLALAFAFGGTAQMIAGVLEFPRGNTLGRVAFLSYGAFWWSFALFVVSLGTKVPEAFVGCYLLVWGVFTFYMWLHAHQHVRATRVPLPSGSPICFWRSERGQGPFSPRIWAVMWA
jgi:succinate-acetate transporter protein